MCRKISRPEHKKQSGKCWLLAVLDCILDCMQILNSRCASTEDLAASQPKRAPACRLCGMDRVQLKPPSPEHPTIPLSCRRHTWRAAAGPLRPWRPASSRWAAGCGGPAACQSGGTPRCSACASAAQREGNTHIAHAVGGAVGECAAAFGLGRHSTAWHWGESSDGLPVQPVCDDPLLVGDAVGSNNCRSKEGRDAI